VKPIRNENRRKFLLKLNKLNIKEKYMPTKILVVDDEKDMWDLITQKFRKEFLQGEYEFYFAGNGKEALKTVEKEDDIDIILLDINMQVMDGLTFLENLKELDKPLLRPIVISGYGDMQNIRSAMNRGAFDFLFKPIDFKDLKKTIDKCLKDEQRCIKAALQASDELKLLTKELKEAAEIQSAMLIKEFPERKEFDIHARMIPARMVGGDFYDFFSLDKNRLGIVVGDVSGKGVSAAFMMGVSQNIIHNLALKGIPVDTCLEKANEEYFKIFPINFFGKFVTVFYGILDTRDGSFDYCSAGHLPPYLVSSGGEIIRLENKGGWPMGIEENAPYEFKRITLKPGDTVLVYTDGITEAREKGEKEEKEFGENRLQKCLQELYTLQAEKITAGVVEAVQEFCQGYQQWDDLTCLALKYTGKQEEG
jgi:sigma-B regulation protein RsbU (phosphoserine phosphatase)